jgi:hypothetical protein
MATDMATDIASLRTKLTRSPAQPPNAPWPRAGLAALWRSALGRAPAWVRRHQRHPCCVIAVMTIRQKDLALEGLVTEVSRGGLLFRPASRFIFDRVGADVVISFADDELAGAIVNVKATGYGIALDQTIEEERVQAILGRFGVEPSALS